MRIDYTKISPEATKAVYGLANYVQRHSKIEAKLLHLIELRCSQINGCAFCVHLHSLQLRAMGETEPRIDCVGTWEETELFTDRERAALAWAEGVTNVAEGHVPDWLFEEVRKHFDEQELVDLTLAIATINVWNRLSISFRADPLTAPALLTASH